ncbi:chromatin assembly factor 1 subunit A, partial [Kipferlia bialata]
TVHLYEAKDGPVMQVEADTPKAEQAAPSVTAATPTPTPGKAPPSPSCSPSPLFVQGQKGPEPISFGVVYPPRVSPDSFFRRISVAEDIQGREGETGSQGAVAVAPPTQPEGEGEAEAEAEAEGEHDDSQMSGIFFGVRSSSSAEKQRPDTDVSMLDGQESAPQYSWLVRDRAEAHCLSVRRQSVFRGQTVATHMRLPSHARLGLVLCDADAPRPAFYGTISDTPKAVTLTQPLALEPGVDYGYSSDADWSDDMEEGEVLDGDDSESEGEREAIKQIEADQANQDVLVPTGYLSESEVEDMEAKDGSQGSSGESSEGGCLSDFERDVEGERQRTKANKQRKVLIRRRAGDDRDGDGPAGKRAPSDTHAPEEAESFGSLYRKQMERHKARSLKYRGLAALSAEDMTYTGQMLVASAASHPHMLSAMQPLFCAAPCPGQTCLSVPRWPVRGVSPEDGQKKKKAKTGKLVPRPAPLAAVRPTTPEVSVQPGSRQVSQTVGMSVDGVCHMMNTTTSASQTSPSLLKPKEREFQNILAEHTVMYNELQLIERDRETEID